jgi:hypothetical protein
LDYLSALRSTAPFDPQSVEPPTNIAMGRARLPTGAIRDRPALVGRAILTLTPLG